MAEARRGRARLIADSIESIAVPVDLTDADRAILDRLSEGRCTVGYLADETEYSRQHVHNRLNVLLAAEYVRKVHDPTGLYELRVDPR